MDPPSSPEEADVTSPVHYDTEAFDRSVRQLLADTDERRGGAQVILFHGGTRELRQTALASLTRYTTANVHQFRVPSLLAEQRMQTQNTLRKAFDHAAEESALLFFDSVDALFTHTHIDTDDAEDDPVPSTTEYFFDRVVAYDGVIVLALQKRSHVEWAKEHAHLVIEFEG